MEESKKTLVITPEIWRLKVYQKSTANRYGLHGIAWHHGHAYATDGSSLVAVEDTQEVPGTWRVLLDGRAPTEDITVPLSLGCHVVKQPKGYSIVEIYDCGENPVPWEKVIPEKKDAYRMLSTCVLKKVFEAVGKNPDDPRMMVRFYEPDKPLSPMRLDLPGIVAIIMPCRMD